MSTTQTPLTLEARIEDWIDRFDVVCELISEPFPPHQYPPTTYEGILESTKNLRRLIAVSAKVRELDAELELLLIETGDVSVN